MDPNQQTPPVNQPTAGEPAAQQPVYQAPPTNNNPVNPGAKGTSGLSIAGLILAFVAPIVGLILSIVGYSKSKKMGQKTTVSIIGICVAAFNILILTPIIVILVLSAASKVQQDAGGRTPVQIDPTIQDN